MYSKFLKLLGQIFDLVQNKCDICLIPQLNLFSKKPSNNLQEPFFEWVFYYLVAEVIDDKPPKNASRSVGHGTHRTGEGKEGIVINKRLSVCLNKNIRKNEQLEN